MKNYSIPVTHTARTVVEHMVEAKNMQEAMFKIGQALTDAADPFECVTTAGIDVEVEIRPGSPQIVPDQTALDLNPPSDTSGPVGEVATEPVEGLSH